LRGQHKNLEALALEMDKNLDQFFSVDWFFLVYTGIDVGSDVTRYIKGCPTKHENSGGEEFPRCSRQGTNVQSITNHRKSRKFGFGNISFLFRIPTSLSFGAPLLETL
jgi:hypothetical protein